VHHAESLATQSTEAETALAMQGLGFLPVIQYGRRVSAELAAPSVGPPGDEVAAFALNEPEDGYDAAAMALRDEPAAPGWRLTGEKMGSPTCRSRLLHTD